MSDDFFPRHAERAVTLPVDDSDALRQRLSGHGLSIIKKVRRFKLMEAMEASGCLDPKLEHTHDITMITCYMDFLFRESMFKIPIREQGVQTKLQVIIFPHRCMHVPPAL